MRRARSAARRRLGLHAGASVPRRARRRTASTDPRDVAVTLEAVAGALRAGAGLGQALSAATRGAAHPFADGLARVAADLDAGGGVDAALERWAARRPDRWSRVVADACRLGVAMGAGLPEALDRVAAGARDEADLAADVRVLTAPARASAMMMAAMPVGFGLVVVLPDPGLRSVLLGTGPGLACLAVATLAEALGAVWMRSLVRTVR